MPPTNEKKDAAAGGEAANDRAKAALARSQAAESAAATIERPQKSLIELLNDPGQKEQIARALPSAMNIERFTRLCVTVVRSNAALQQCSAMSLLAACMQSAQLGLEPGVLGQAYLVPYYNNKKRMHEVQFIVGYQGYIDLFYRSGQVTSVVAREVCENDEYECVFGIQDTLRHKKARSDRGEPHTYYGLARLLNGDHVLHEMNLEAIAERRNRSRARDAGPWITDEAAMSRKTVIRAMVPFLPKTVELGQALAADESVPTTFGEHMADTLAQQAPIDVHEADDEDPGEQGELVPAGAGEPEDPAGSDTE